MKNDGGPAFPSVHATALGQDGVTLAQTVALGMSLRDAFAIGITKGMIPWDFSVNIKGLDEYAENYARTVYKIADAMLAERAKP